MIRPNGGSERVLRASARETVITPAESLMLVGALEPSTGVHDDLYARVLVLCDGTTRVAIVTLDLIGMSFAMADDIRSAIRTSTGIEHVLLCCSHTHSAPFTIPWSLLGYGDFHRTGGVWRKQLTEAIVGLVSSAQEDLREVVLSVGRENVQIGHNRRVLTPGGVVMQPNRDGSAAQWTDIIKVEDRYGQVIAIMFNHSAHPVVVHGTSTQISADYPGYAAATVRQRFGDGCVAMFVQGCAGNVNAPLLEGFDIALATGEQLGEAAVSATQSSTPIEGSELSVSSVIVSLPLEEMPTAEECDEILTSARKDLAAAEQSESSSPNLLWELRDRVLILEDLSAKVAIGDTQELRFEITALKIGREWCMTAMTHEVFADYQLWAETESPFKHNMTVAYTNGCESYIPTDADLELGGYEAAACPRRAGIAASMASVKYPYRLALRPGAEKKIKDAMIRVWG